jgi:hypothetical protein
MLKTSLSILDGPIQMELHDFGPTWVRERRFSYEAGLARTREWQPNIIALILFADDLPRRVAELHQAAPAAKILVLTRTPLDEDERDRLFDAGCIMTSCVEDWAKRRAELTLEQATEWSRMLYEMLVAMQRPKQRRDAEILFFPEQKRASG